MPFVPSGDERRFLFPAAVTREEPAPPPPNAPDPKIKKGREKKMFGLRDASILLAYLLCFASALLCVVYGVLNWNKDSDDDGGNKK